MWACHFVCMPMDPTDSDCDSVGFQFKMLHDIDEVTHAQQSLHQHFRIRIGFLHEID